MVQILKAPERSKSFTERLGTGLVQAGQAAGKLIPEYFIEKEKEEKIKKSREEIGKLTGIDASNIEPEFLKIILSENLKQKSKAESLKNENTAGKLFAKGYNAIQSGDTNIFKEVLEDPETPLSTKQKLVDIQNQHKQRKSVDDAELRQRQSLVERSYTSAINSLIAQEKNATSTDKKANIQKEIDKLKSLKKADLHNLSKDAKNYFSLHLWDHMADEFHPKMGEESIQSGQEQQVPEQMPMENPIAEMAASQNQVQEEVPPEIQYLNKEFPPDKYLGKRKSINNKSYRSNGETWLPE